MPAISARGRTLWKSLHGVTGFWMAAVLVVFLLTGLSWAGIWGSKFVQAWSTFPAEKWDAVPLSDATHASMNHRAVKEVPWGLEQTLLPVSGSAAGAPALPHAPGIDDVAAFAAGLGFPGRFQIALPAGETGVWTVSHDSMSNDGPNPSADRTIHIDRHSGRILADVGFADYSPWAKAMAWGIAFHEGDLGVWNIALNTLFCLSMIFLPVSGFVLWWKRRPAGAARLAAPPRAGDVPFWRAACLMVVALGVLFPLAGAVILAVLALDWLVIRRIAPLRRALA